jgi:hypothetical protein
MVDGDPRSGAQKMDKLIPVINKLQASSSLFSPPVVARRDPHGVNRRTCSTASGAMPLSTCLRSPVQLEPSLAPFASLPATVPRPHRGQGSRADSLLDSGRRAEQRQIVCPRGYPDPDPGFAIIGGHSARWLAEHCGARLPPPWVRHCDPQVPPFSPHHTPCGPPDSDTPCAPP